MQFSSRTRAWLRTIAERSARSRCGFNKTEHPALPGVDGVVKPVDGGTSTLTDRAFNTDDKAKRLVLTDGDCRQSEGQQ
jgi:hypothetical protein